MVDVGANYASQINTSNRPDLARHIGGGTVQLSMVPTDKWGVTLSIGYARSNYQAPDIVYQAGRSDNLLSGNAVLQYKLTKELSARLEGTFYNNTSKFAPVFISAMDRRIKTALRLEFKLMSYLQGQLFMYPFFSRFSKAAKCFALVLVIVVISSLLTNAYAQNNAEAGRLLMSIGDVKIARNGQTIPAPKGTAVLSGDSVITGVASNAQIRMSDVAIIALRAQTEFKINEYKFNGRSDGSEKANLSLVKGGVRAVTGPIGRENKDNLQVNAVVATVGIRGAGYNLNYCDGNCLNLDKTPVKDGLYAGVFEGQITIKNKAGTESLGVDQFAYVADDNSQAKRLTQPPNFLPDPFSWSEICQT